MSSVAGPYFAAVVLLAVAGLAKLVWPMPTAQAMRDAGLPGGPGSSRLLGAVELFVTAAALGIGGRLPALAVGLVYVGFAVFTYRLVRRGGNAECGCFGKAKAPATRIHVALNAAAAACAGLAAGAPIGALSEVLGEQPLGGLPFLALVGLLAWLAYVSFTWVPVLNRAMSAEPPRRQSRR